MNKAKAKGNNQPQAGTLARPEAHNDKGKPKASAHWRARVLPMTLKATPTAHAKTMAQTSGIRPERFR
jgi:hypothetical protein